MLYPNQQPLTSCYQVRGFTSYQLGMARFHLYLTLLWASLAIPTLLWWKDSILWVSIMSLYANVVGHWSTYQSAHAEERLVAKLRKVYKEVHYPGPDNRPANSSTTTTTTHDEHESGVNGG